MFNSVKTNTDATLPFNKQKLLREIDQTATEDQISEDQKKIAALCFAIGYKYKLNYIETALNDQQNPQPDTIFIEKIDDKLRCSVKQIFATTFQSIEIDAEKLKRAILSKDELANPSEALIEAIVDCTSQAGITNTGLEGLEDGPAVADSDSLFKRRTMFALVTLALVSEFGFAFLQLETAAVGWMAILDVISVAYIFAFAGSLIDLIVNVKSVSPKNDANFNVFTKIVTTSYFMLLMLWMIRAASVVSFLAGGSGNILGVLPYLLHKNTSEPVKNLVLTLSIFVAIVGLSYYWAFNGNPMARTFAAIEKYFSAKKADHNFFRWIKIIEENLYLFGFRAGSFTAIGLKVIQNFISLSEEEKIDIASIIFISSIINLAATRSSMIVNYWSNNDNAHLESMDRFPYIAPKEKKIETSIYLSYYLGENIASNLTSMYSCLKYKFPYSASKEKSTEPPAWLSACLGRDLAVDLTYLPSILLGKDTAAQALVSTGYALLGAQSSSPTLATLWYSLSGGLFINNIFALCNKAANAAARKALLDEDDKEIERRKENYIAKESCFYTAAVSAYNTAHNAVCSSYSLINNDDTQQPLLEAPSDKELYDAKRDKRIKTVNHALGVLSSTFPQETFWRQFLAGGSTLTRGIGFTDFANTISLLLGLKLNNQQTLGMVFVLAATNMRNMFGMFLGNIVEYASAKDAETVVAYCEAIKHTANKPAFGEWKKSHWGSLNYTLFTKGGLEYDVTDIKAALLLKAKEYGYTPIMSRV